MPNPSATPTPITPPRVPLIDERTGLIERSWYMFFLSLFNAAQAGEDFSTAPDVNSLLASYDAALNALAVQALSTPPADAQDTIKLLGLNSAPPPAELTQLQDTAESSQMDPVNNEQVAALAKRVQALEEAPLPVESVSVVSTNLTRVPYIGFDTAPLFTPTEKGYLYWDQADGNQTLSVVMDSTNNVVQQIGEEQFYRIKASSAITNGQVVMFTGSVGASGALTGAPATSLAANTAIYTMGVATMDIPTNSWGYVTSFGLIRGINTTGGSESWVDGQILYLNPAVSGGLTKTVPVAPNPKVVVAAVVHASTNGSLFVRPSFGGKLGDFEGDVNISGVADGQILQYVAANNRWENKTSTSSGTVTSVNVAGGTTGMTFSGGPITTSGTVTMAGTLAIANGGTNGSAVPTAGAVAYGDGTSYKFTASGSGTKGQLLIFNDDTGQPQWANQVAAVTYGTLANGTSTSSNAYFGENTGYATIGGANGVALAVGTPYPGTAKVSVDTVAFRPITNATLSCGTSGQRWSSVYSVNADFSGTIGGGTWNGATIGIAYGGTGATTASTALTKLLPSQTGNNGKVLGTDGTSASWVSQNAGTVTSVGMTVPSFLSVSGSPVTSSGTLAVSLSGTPLPVANGGTGASSFASAGLPTLSGTNAFTGKITMSNTTSELLAKTYGTSDGGTGINGCLGESAAYALLFGANGVTFSSGTSYPGTARVVVDGAVSLRPASDSTLSCGTTGQRWTTIYAVTGTINTSDAREKEQISKLTNPEFLVAKKLKKLIRTYKWQSSVKKKGDKARIHVGIMAQDVIAAFESEGLDARQYGVLCEDYVEDLQRHRLGVRYDELLAFIIAVI